MDLFEEAGVEVVPFWLAVECIGCPMRDGPGWKPRAGARCNGATRTEMIAVRMGAAQPAWLCRIGKETLGTELEAWRMPGYAGVAAQV